MRPTPRLATDHMLSFLGLVVILRFFGSRAQFGDAPGPAVYRLWRLFSDRLSSNSVCEKEFGEIELGSVSENLRWRLRDKNSQYDIINMIMITQL